MNNVGNPPPVYIKDGPIQNRSCQDILCLLILLVSVGYYIFSFTQLVAIENPLDILFTPHDSDYNQCGKGKLADYKYIYFVSPYPASMNRTTCVKQCPSNLSQNQTTTYKLECYINSQVKQCSYKNTSIPQTEILIYNTKTDITKSCLPIDEQLFNNIRGFCFIEKVILIIYELQKVIPLLILSAFLTFIVGVIFLGTMIYCENITTWSFLVNGFILAVVIGSLLTFRIFDIKVPFLDQYKVEDEFSNNITSLNINYDNKIYLIVGALFCWILAALIIILSIKYRKNIKYMIYLLKVSAIFIRNNLSIYGLPVCLFCILLLLFGFTCSYSVFLIASAPKNTASNFAFDNVVIDQKVINELLLQLLFFIMLREFLILFGDYIIVYSSCLWYYQKDQQEKKSIVWVAVKETFRYHIGSIAYASILFIFVKPLSSITRYIHNYLLPYTQKDKNKLAHFFSLCCLYSCCLFTCFIQYINKYGLVYQAMTGESLWSSIMSAHYLVKRNKLRHTTVQNLQNLFNSLGKWFLCLFSTLVCYVLTYVLPQYNDIQESITPILGYLILSYTTASFFIDMHGSSAYTLLLVSLIDEEVEKTHFGREEAYNCPMLIRPLINNLRRQK